MKKIAIYLMSIIIFTGCTVGIKNDITPSSTVESFLNKYQILDTSVLNDLDAIISNEYRLIDEQKKK